MSKILSLKKDFIQVPVKITKEFSGIGLFIQDDVFLDKTPALREFYYRNYRHGYILGETKLSNWMFKNNGGHVAVLFDGGKIIAHQGHVPIVFTDGQNDYRGFISASTMTDVDYRRKGLMSYLRGEVQNRYEMAVSIGGSTDGVRLYSSMGYKLYGILTRLVAVVDSEMAKKISKNSENLKATVVTDCSGDSTDVRSILKFEAISESLDNLRNAIFTKNNIFGVKRDWEFLDWRYTDHPYFDYQRFGLWENGVLSGVMVFRREEVKGIGYLIRIVELIGYGAALSKLIKKALFTKEMLNKVAWIDWYCSNNSISDILRDLGFQTDETWKPVIFPHYCSPVDYFKKNYPFMFWAKNDELFGKAPADLEHWYVTKGDGDADRPNDSWVTPALENEGL